MKTLAGLLACVVGCVGLRAETTLTVSAAASLKDALTKVQALYTEAQPDVKIVSNFAGSGPLQQQIEAGAPVDIFISAAVQQMDALAQKDLLIKGTRRVLLTNRLALIVPKDTKLVNSFSDLVDPELRHIAIGDPKAVPAGVYATEVLKTLGLTAAVEPKLVRLLDVRQVLTTVATGDADAGFVYASDARLSDRVRIAAMAVPGTHSPIVYPVAVIKDSQHPEAAQAFVAFLASDAARKVFEQFGFGIPR
jgi:molybdate transport system substrate-binding protein